MSWKITIQKAERWDFLDELARQQMNVLATFQGEDQEQALNVTKMLTEWFKTNPIGREALRDYNLEAFGKANEFVILQLYRGDIVPTPGGNLHGRVT